MRETQRERNSVDVIIFKYSRATPLPTGGSLDAGAASSLAKRRRAVARWWYLVLGRRASSTSSSQVDLCENWILLTLKFSLTFTDFPSNVCVVPMLAFFVYARFFLPTTRRRGRQSRPTRVMRFRHATRDASSENNETTTTTTKKKKKRKEFLQRERREKKGKKNVLHVSLFEEKERNVSKLSSLVKTQEKKRDTKTTFRKRSLLTLSKP